MCMILTCALKLSSVPTEHNSSCALSVRLPDNRTDSILQVGSYSLSSFGFTSLLPTNAFNCHDTIAYIRGLSWDSNKIKVDQYDCTEKIIALLVKALFDIPHVKFLLM